MTRLRVALAASLTSFVLAGCDSGPSGPGSYYGRAIGPSVGGVVLEIEGTGIQGFTGRGSTRAYSAPVPGRPNTHRLVLIDPQGGDLGFDMLVDDLDMHRPYVTVVEATGTDNRRAAPGSVTIRFGS